MFIKYRAEKDSYEIVFSERLGTLETIASTSVSIDLCVLDDWVVQSGMVSGVAIIESGKTISFTIITAVLLAQVPGRYRIRCIAMTSAGRTLQGNQDLRIHE